VRKIRLKICKYSALSGILAAILPLIVLPISGYIQPDYSQIENLISELNERGLPYSLPIGYFGFLPIGLATLFFIWRLKSDIVHSKRSIVGLLFIALSGVDWVVTVFAPCDQGCPASGDISLSQEIHNLSGFLTLVLVPIGVYLLINPLRESGFGKVVTVMSVITVVNIVVTLAILIFEFFPGAPGLVQRIDLGVFLVYLSILSIKVYTRMSQRKNMTDETDLGSR
jgi:hypothetical protein